MIVDVLVCGALMMAGALMALIWTRRASPREARLLWAGYAFHLVCALAIAAITLYVYGGDAIMYHRFGVEHAELLRRDFGRYAYDLARFTVQLQPLELRIRFAGSATGSMQGVSMWMMLLLADSFYGACVLFGVLSWMSQVMIYDVFKRYFPRALHVRLMLALVFMPSVAFWASGLLKESVAMAAMGPLFWGGARLLAKRWVSGLLVLAPSAFIVSLVKPYVLFPLVIAAGVAFYWFRSLRKHGEVAILRRPLQLAVYGALTVGMLMGLGKLFPRYSVDHIAEEAATLQYYGQLRAGRKANYVIGDHQKRSLSQQVVYMPIGLIFALFRPLPFEVRNAAILLNVAEMLLLYALWFKLLTVRPWRQTLRLIMSHPLLIFCVIFVGIFGALVGISTTNTGTLSRYRIPMMPFYGVLLVVLSAKLTAGAQASPGAREAVTPGAGHGRARRGLPSRRS